MAGLDLDSVRHALDVARKNGYAEVEIRSGEETFTATLEPKKRSAAGAVKEAEPTGPQRIAIASPFVGYYVPVADALAVGKKVSKGDIIATISALGISNDVESKVEGEVVEVLVEAEQPVEYGQPLAYLETK